MPEQQSFVLYIVVGSGSKSGSRLPKTAPGAVFKVWLHGSLVAREPCSLTLKTAPGAVFGSLEPLLEPLPTTI